MVEQKSESMEEPNEMNGSLEEGGKGNAEERDNATPDNPYLPRPVKVISYKKESRDSFTLRISERSFPGPGQFYQVSLFGTGECPISVCSYSPLHVDMNIRIVGNMTSALSKVRKGDTLHIRGPYGHGFPMELLHGNGVIMVGGGCGVAPLRGIVEYIEANRDKFHDVHMYFGFRTPDDVLFKEDIASWQHRFSTNIIINSAPEQTCFDIKTGHVRHELRKSRIDPANKVVFVCGPPLMLKSTSDILLGKGFHEDQLFVSSERLMYCAVGKCGHCMIRGKYTCLDGPVFRWDTIRSCHSE